MHPPSCHEDGLESDAFLAYVALRSGLGALPDITNCRQIFPLEAIFVAINDNSIWVDSEYNIGILPSCVLVVIRVLEKFKNESRLACVQILC